MVRSPSHREHQLPTFIECPILTGAPPIADALVLVFTPGVSIEQWRDTGMLDREWMLYERLSRCYGQLILVTDGGAEDQRIARVLGASTGASLSVLTAETDVQSVADPGAIGERLGPLLGDARTVVIKTNQFQAGPRAIAITHHLRGSGIRCALLARGGYLWSRFAAYEHGAGSNEAREAARTEAELCAEADLVVGTTQEMCDDLAWRYEIPANRLRLIPNYVPALPPTSVAPMRDPHRVLFAGRFVEQKRLDLLIEAVALARAQRALPLTLRLIGAGPQQDSILENARRQDVPLEVFGRMPHVQLMEEMSRCAVYVQTSSFEGHPKTVLEAMSRASPVVVTDSPGLGNVVRHEVTGLRAESDPGSVSQCIQRLVGEALLREGLGKAAQSWVLGKFSIDSIIPLEHAAHQDAIGLSQRVSRSADRCVFFAPSLLQQDTNAVVNSWQLALDGFCKRLAPDRRAKFLAALDAPIYEMQGRSASDANRGLHPKHHLMRYHDFFVERIGAGEKIIDLGCGVGELACSIAERSGAHVVGVDWSRDNLSKARAAAASRSLSRVAWHLGDISKDRLDGRFDVVVLSNVLEHMKERSSLLARLREWYGPSRFLIRVPAFDREWRVPWKRSLGVEWRLDPTHETEYTESQLRVELGESGLRLTELVTRWGEYWCVASPA